MKVVAILLKMIYKELIIFDPLTTAEYGQRVITQQVTPSCQKTKNAANLPHFLFIGHDLQSGPQPRKVKTIPTAYTP